MIYYLDSNICIYFLKGQHQNIKDKLENINPTKIKIPSIVKAELLYGAEKSKNRSSNVDKVLKFIDPFEIIPFDDEASIFYSKIRSSLEIKGTIIGPNDYIIASIVLSKNGILVTNNESEFKRIKNLKIENWAN
jgi:tRNA(fMet)-specific endonuclease VapC